jgi:hypothetical protein
VDIRTHVHEVILQPYAWRPFPPSSSLAFSTSSYTLQSSDSTMDLNTRDNIVSYIYAQSWETTSPALWSPNAEMSMVAPDIVAISPHLGPEAKCIVDAIIPFIETDDPVSYVSSLRAACSMASVDCEGTV